MHLFSQERKLRFGELKELDIGPPAACVEKTDLEPYHFNLTGSVHPVHHALSLIISIETREASLLGIYIFFQFNYSFKLKHTHPKERSSYNESQTPNKCSILSLFLISHPFLFHPGLLTDITLCSYLSKFILYFIGDFGAEFPNSLRDGRNQHIFLIAMVPLLMQSVSRSFISPA